MKKRFWDRLCLFGGGCATARVPSQPQPLPQAELPVQVMPRGELLFLIVVVLVIIALIIPFFTGKKGKGREARPERKKRRR